MADQVVDDEMSVLREEVSRIEAEVNRLRSIVAGVGTLFRLVSPWPDVDDDVGVTER